LTSRDFKELNQLEELYAARGLQIMMFPSNTFNQEPHDSDKIEKTYRGKLGAKFWISEKIEVNGADTHPVFVFLRQNSPLSNLKKNANKPGAVGQIPWNYTKFLVNS